MDENNNKIENCRGSFKVGTACGVCGRCKSRGYDAKMKADAEKAEVERTKDLPASRVKPDGYVAQKSEEQKAEEKAELKEEIKDELKPELKEEIKEELKKEEKEAEPVKPIEPAPTPTPNPKK